MSRFEIEREGQNPLKLAQAIHKQLGDFKTKHVPIVDIALALNIVEIREAELDSFEGCILVPPNKSRGSILVNSRSGFRRQRFTIAHELCHFLHPKHKPLPKDGGTSATSFLCSKTDMAVSAGWGGRALTPYQKQEAQANQFAAEILMPKSKFLPALRAAPNLEHVVERASALKVSKEAAALRYVELHDDPIAIVHSRHGKVLRWSKPEAFPRVLAWNGDLLSGLLRPKSGQVLTELDDVSPEDWLARPKSHALQAQTLFQQNGFAMTLLHNVESNEEDGDELKDTFEHFSRL